MDISIDTTSLVNAAMQRLESKAKLAYAADLTPETFKKVLNGDTDVAIKTIGKAADFLGFETRISFVRKKNGNAAE